MSYKSPYDRIKILQDGTALVWPFLGQKISMVKRDLLLDNNAMIRSNWYDALPDEMKNTCQLCVFQAMEEQWVSNPAFSEDPCKRIEQMTTPFLDKGAQIAEDLLRLPEQLKSTDTMVRKSWMTSYLYAVLLYRIHNARRNDNKPKQLLETLKYKQVPRFGGLVILCTIAAYLKDNQNVKMKGDIKKTYSYVQDFTSAKLKKKKEQDGDVAYLRNRAGDFCLWLLPLKLHAKADYERRAIADASKVPFETLALDTSFLKALTVTNDKALHSFIMRCIPFELKNNFKLEPVFDGSHFAPQDAKNINDLIKANTDWQQYKNQQVTVNLKDQYAAQKELFAHVTDGADNYLVSEATKVWNDWLKPGFTSAFNAD
jgi:hypothetical protein